MKLPTPYSPTPSTLRAEQFLLPRMWFWFPTVLVWPRGPPVADWVSVSPSASGAKTRPLSWNELNKAAQPINNMTSNEWHDKRNNLVIRHSGSARTRLLMSCVNPCDTIGVSTSGFQACCGVAHTGIVKVLLGISNLVFVHVDRKIVCTSGQMSKIEKMFLEQLGAAIIHRCGQKCSENGKVSVTMIIMNYNVWDSLTFKGPVCNI